MESESQQQPAETAVVAAQVKQRAREAWAIGDYPTLALRDLWPLGEWIVARAGIAPGTDPDRDLAPAWFWGQWVWPGWGPGCALHGVGPSLV